MKKRRRVVRLFKSPINWGAFFRFHSYKPTYNEGTIDISGSRRKKEKVRSLTRTSHKSERNG